MLRPYGCMYWLDIALGMDARGFLLLEHARRETDMMDENDRKYMMMAMDEAEKGVGLVSPNPMVGAVIVRDGRVIGKGHHRKYGGLHAEREALEDCKSRGETPAGAVMYVTLEPCCHYGKQPPCTEAIIEAGIARVVAGMGDPNPLVCGKGLRILQEAGIETECGLCENELREQNRVFLKYIITGRPWVALKYAMTADGKIAAVSGDSKWISGDVSRRRVHLLRNRYTGIVAGKGTVDADDPMLNCRLASFSENGEGAQGRSPLRIVLDSSASIPLGSNIVRTAKEYGTLLVHTSRADLNVLQALSEEGVETLLCPRDAKGRPDVSVLCGLLGERGVDSILVEGGSETAWSFIQAGLVDEYYFFIAPKIVGGSGAKSPVGGDGFLKMSDAVNLAVADVMVSGGDVEVHAYRKEYFETLGRSVCLRES